MTPDVHRTVRQAGFTSAVIGVVLSPIPLADELVLLPVYGVMTARIAKHHGLTRAQIPWRPIVGTTFAGLAARAALNLTVSFVPGVAAIANAASAAALTELLGHYVDAACENPGDARVFSVRELAERLRGRKA